MNLIKLFNVKYLMQNIKKSKNIIILCLTIMPILSAILLTVIGTSKTYSSVVSSKLTILNIIGMYIIPVAISMCLFGYVFRRNSVDFINSMPLSRKTIFVTNTVGGIILIALTQLLALILTWIVSLFFTQIIIFNGYLIDIFFIMLVSYIFVFTSANLAMTISGNYLTQIAVTLLILFLIPFSIDAFNGFSSYKNIKLENTSYEFSGQVSSSYEYTEPYKILSSLIVSSRNEIFNFKTMCNMLILTIVYIALGMILFEKRKMENTEESFANVYVHLFVKMLTLIPFVVLINFIDSTTTVFIFEVALIAIYYFVYDLVTKRKVKFLLSVVSFAVSLVILLSICKIVGEKEKNYIFELKNIEKISINLSDSNAIYISDKDIINYVYKNIENKATYDYGYRYYSNNPVSSVNIYPIECSFKMKDGNEVKFTLRLEKSAKEELNNKLLNSEEYKKEKKSKFEFPDNAVYYFRENRLNEDEIKILKREIEKSLDNVDELTTYYYSQYNFSIYAYKNHNVIEINLPITLTEDTFKVITKNANMKAYESVKNNKVISCGLANLGEYADDEPMYYDAIRYCTDDFTKFIEQNYNDVCDMNSKYYVIYLYSDIGKGESFFTNKIEEINKILENAILNNKDEFQYYYDTVEVY